MPIWEQVPRLDARLKALIEDHSARETAIVLAREFGLRITKCAVIGRCHRLKLRLRFAPVTRPSAPRVRARVRPQPKVRPPVPPPVAAPPQLEGLLFEQLDARTCRYPLRYPYFCGAAVEGRAVYCAAHKRMARR
jgi:hypothetical protein